jgi:hypothetical protein
MRICLGAWMLWAGAGMPMPATAAGPVPSHAVGEAAAELERLLDAPANPASQAEILRWMIRHNHAFTLELAADSRVENRYSHPILRRLRYSTQSVDWRRGVQLLSPEEQHRLYCLQRPRHPRDPSTALPPAATIYRPADFVPASCLLTDFLLQHAIGYLVEHPTGARYDGVHGHITYSDPLLARTPECIWHFLREDPAGFQRTLAAPRNRPLYEQLMADTYSDDPASWTEPYDHLCARLQTDLVAALAAESHDPYIDRAALRRFCRQYTDIAFAYPRERIPAPPVAFGHNGDAQTRTFDFLCVGTPERVRIGEPALTPPEVVAWFRGDAQPGPGAGRFVERLQAFAVPGFPVTYGILDLRPDRNKAAVRLSLDCATGVYALSFEVEEGEGSLPPVPEQLRRDQATAAGEINAVISLALFPALSHERFAEAMDHFVRAGFKAEAAPAVIPDLWEDFRREVGRGNTALVVPVYHVVDQEQFRVGWNHARKLVFRKRLADTHGAAGGIRWIRVAAYVPPAVSGTKEILLSRAAFGDLFRARALSPEKEDTLCLLNMSCFSQYTVESWMAAFREAVRDVDPAAMDPMDIPFLIGSRHGFDPEEPGLLMDILDHMLRGLSEGRTRSGILAALATCGEGRYDPVSNSQRPDLLRMGGGFRLRVTNAANTAESTSF